MNKDYALQDAANDALEILSNISEQLDVVREFVNNTGDKDMLAAAQQSVDAVTLLRLKMFNRSAEGKFRK